MNIRHDDDFKISVNFVGEDGTPLNNSEVKFNFVYQDCEDNKYEVSFDGTTRLNNVVKDNRIVIIFNANTFQRGQLLFEDNTIVEEIYLPEICSENWKSLGYMLKGCIRLRKLVFPKDHTLFSYINDLTASFGSLYNLEEIENFPNESIGKFSDKAIICTGFNLFKYSMGFGNDKIKLRCFIANDSYINSLQFSNESPFDYGSTHINLLRAKFEKDSLLSLFNRLPDFTNSNSRTINIVDNPGTSELMEEDIKIATDKNWVVITK